MNTNASQRPQTPHGVFVQARRLKHKINRHTRKIPCTKTSSYTKRDIWDMIQLKYKLDINRTNRTFDSQRRKLPQRGEKIIAGSSSVLLVKGHQRGTRGIGQHGGKRFIETKTERAHKGLKRLSSLKSPYGHPSEWSFCGYREIQEPKRKNVLIDYEKLRELLGFDTYDRVSIYHKRWVEDYLGNGKIPVMTNGLRVLLPVEAKRRSR